MMRYAKLMLGQNAIKTDDIAAYSNRRGRCGERPLINGPKPGKMYGILRILERDLRRAPKITDARYYDSRAYNCVTGADRISGGTGTHRWTETLPSILQQYLVIGSSNNSPRLRDRQRDRSRDGP
jgi:hypothetical protein